MAIEKEFFRQVMGRFATGVTVVTARSRETLAGLTVNAFCSVSLNPPLVLVCVDLTSATLPVIRESGVFAVNILTDKQEHLSRCFATPSRERFECFCHAGYHVEDRLISVGGDVVERAGVGFHFHVASVVVLIAGGVAIGIDDTLQPTRVVIDVARGVVVRVGRRREMPVGVVAGVPHVPGAVGAR